MLNYFTLCVILFSGDKKMTMYDRIRELRIKSGMSQDDLAKAMGYSDRSMITKIESGKVDISQKKILAFARVLNTTTGYLMGLSEDDSVNILHDQPLMPDEYRLINAWRGAEKDAQRFAMEMLMNHQKKDTSSKAE